MLVIVAATAPADKSRGPQAEMLQSANSHRRQHREHGSCSPSLAPKTSLVVNDGDAQQHVGRPKGPACSIISAVSVRCVKGRSGTSLEISGI